MAKKGKKGGGGGGSLPVDGHRAAIVASVRAHTVTVIRGLSLRPPERDALVKTLKTGLGTGASVEDDAIVVQGDLVDRVVAALERAGVRRVIAG